MLVVFGLLSSILDYATFGVLLLIFHTGSAEFRTGWFTESVVSAALVVLVIRTRRPVFRSVPSWKLLTATLLVVAAAILIPFTPLASPLGFVRIPALVYEAIAGIIVAYLLAAEVAKWLFYRLAARRRSPR
jgi:P-type Mg2+ transporter